MLVRKCDMCKKEMKNFWNLGASYVDYGETKENTVTIIEMELCDECLTKLGLADIKQYGYILPKAIGGYENGNKN